ncbi:MAG: CoA transferase [Acidimicrobiales bacterium]|jgi:crotonobetainyl-CoA:carnitine CoA-transferase CaiB-like acyl-CoA transferase|nr:CoA transferase [Acidimicrobiales bacterium]MDP6911842.1 CoA transferase [Acidimicrobiales bacterium]HJM73520.1 CoA transferase [Acidimicrobiales bacterium]HJP24899.1 CoA transferase [Acidimicrobiales bacterium]
MTAPHQAAGPLVGIRILDLTWMLSGPYCTMLLADMGADVIKVENPTGDPMRAVGPYMADDSERHFGGYFQSINRNKRSIVVDLKTDDGRAELLALASTSDAVVENFRSGVLERLGVGYETLREVNPALVYASLRGFGDPRSGATELNDRPAMDYIAQAMSGFMSVTGPPGEPTKAGPGIGDLFPGAITALGVVSAVLSAQRTGEGQYVDIAMYDAMVSLCERIVYQYGYTGEDPIPAGNRHPLWSLYNTFEARDGFVCISAVFAHEWANLADVMGRPELAVDQRFASDEARLVHDDEANEIVAAWIASRTRAEVLDAIGTRVPAAPVQTASDLFSDAHLRQREMIVEVEHPGSARPAAIAGSPFRFAETPAGVRTRAPLLGEHGDEIRQELAAAATDGAYG